MGKAMKHMIQNDSNRFEAEHTSISKEALPAARLIV